MILWSLASVLCGLASEIPGFSFPKRVRNQILRSISKRLLLISMFVEGRDSMCVPEGGLRGQAQTDG